jgi:hypothetical protein
MPRTTAVSATLRPIQCACTSTSRCSGVTRCRAAVTCQDSRARSISSGAATVASARSSSTRTGRTCAARYVSVSTFLATARARDALCVRWAVRPRPSDGTHPGRQRLGDVWVSLERTACAHRYTVPGPCGLTRCRARLTGTAPGIAPPCQRSALVSRSSRTRVPDATPAATSTDGMARFRMCRSRPGCRRRRRRRAAAPRRRG